MQGYSHSRAAWDLDPRGQTSSEPEKSLLLVGRGLLSLPGLEYGEVCLLPRHYKPRAGAGQTRSTLARLEGHIAAPLMQDGREVGLHIFVFCISTRHPSLLPFPKSSLKLHVKALSGGRILGRKERGQVCLGVSRSGLSEKVPPTVEIHMELAAAWTHGLPPEPPLEALAFSSIP